MRVVGEADCLVGMLMRAEDVEGLFIVFKLKVKILDYFIGCLHLLMVDVDLLIQIGLNTDQLFYLCHVFSPTWPF